MKIACLGWGSLIWDPRYLIITRKEWFKDGPNIPIEFVRISIDKRVTLVIDQDSEPITTLWNLMDTDDIKTAFNSLKEREGTINKRIHSIQRDQVTENSIQRTIQEWLVAKELDAAIWTGLYLNNKIQDKRPNASEIVSHLKKLKGSELDKAKEYIIKAPNQVQTKYRETIMSEMNWK